MKLKRCLLPRWGEAPITCKLQLAPSHRGSITIKVATALPLSSGLRQLVLEGAPSVELSYYQVATSPLPGLSYKQVANLALRRGPNYMQVSTAPLAGAQTTGPQRGSPQ